MQVDITLTPEGVAACFCSEEDGAAAVPLEPLAVVFEYLAMLAQAPPEHCWEELRTAAEAEFRCGWAAPWWVGCTYSTGPCWASAEFRGAPHQSCMPCF